MPGLATLAEAFRYPTPGGLAALQAGALTLPPGRSRSMFASFLQAIEPLSLAAWEELFTRTLDLDPLVAPYVAYQVWGERYQRGELMAELNRAYAETDLDTDGELPDHLVPVLRYLDREERPVAALCDALSPALSAMRESLAAADAASPYLYLLDATREVVAASLRPDPDPAHEGRTS